MAKIILELFDRFTLRELSSEHVCIVVSPTEEILLEKTNKGEWCVNNINLPAQEKFVLTDSVPKEMQVVITAIHLAINCQKHT